MGILPIQYNIRKLEGAHMKLNYVAIGKRIRKLRKMKHMTQDDLRDKVNLSKTHMSHIETGSTKLSLPVLVDIANALEVTADQLLTDCVSPANGFLKDELGNLLDDCDAFELHILIDIMSNVKKAMRNTSGKDIKI